jgi:hypothetical protein
MISNEIVANYKVLYHQDLQLWFWLFFHLGSLVQLEKIEFQNLSASNRIM